MGNTVIGMAVYKTKTFRTLVNYILIRFSVVAFLFVEVLAVNIKEWNPRVKTLCTGSLKTDWIIKFILSCYDLSAVHIDGSTVGH